MKKERTRKIFYTSLQFLAILCLILVLRAFVLNPVEVIGVSMEPTYHESDRLWQSPLLEPKRFSIITFKSPRTGHRIIKRVIGLPGDTVQVKNDQLYINEQPYDEPYLENFKNELTDGHPLTTDFSLETIQEGAASVVPQDSYFVLGDNRRKADDSRYFGFVDKNEVFGTVYFRYYPFNKLGMQ